MVDGKTVLAAIIAKPFHIKPPAVEARDDTNGDFGPFQDLVDACPNFGIILKYLEKFDGKLKKYLQGQEVRPRVFEQIQ